ncbi:uncharacterized protein LOC105696567 isoform X2 [Orussus abietinus]|uniref:uncharacterized protein LOC105696567 isoform X2 n=1 Tax=Orussus abietinus TaxID=222816 RepID=UPI000625A77C|nr:uncharacterized protein LOC105696567 isoform X2 [Orussus abietinus]
MGANWSTSKMYEGEFPCQNFYARERISEIPQSEPCIRNVTRFVDFLISNVKGLKDELRKIEYHISLSQFERHLLEYSYETYGWMMLIIEDWEGHLLALQPQEEPTSWSFIIQKERKRNKTSDYTLV